jgi:cell division protein FtsL
VTSDEIGWLLTGTQLGVMLCVLVSAISTVRLARRTQASAEATSAQARKYRATDGWRALLIDGDGR